MEYQKDQPISIAYGITDIARYYRICFDKEMARHDLTRSQWWLIANLQYHNGCSQQYLSELMDMGKSAVGKIIDQLEKKGWVERVPNKTDKRAYEIYLTSKVAPLVKSIDKQAHSLIDQSLSDLSERQQQQFKNMIEKVKKQLVAMSQPEE